MFIEIYQKVLNIIAAGQKAVVMTVLKSAALAKSIISEDDLVTSGGHDIATHKLAMDAFEKGVLQIVRDQSGDIYIAEPYYPESRLVILGGGHIAKPLAEFGSKCGFSVTVVDDRPSFANEARFPEAHQVICESFDHCFQLLNINRFTFVVIITRGHRHDLECLRQVLTLETAYTGMIGSRRRVAGVRQQLIDEGHNQEKLSTVNAPIGLDIAAQTPEEIAISILSQVIQFKRKNKEYFWPELDVDVLDVLSEEHTAPMALVTIIETKGSVPRDIGAKMIVWPYGKTLGSIGGGCSESSVIQSAYDVIRDGGFKIIDVDMTGAVAEDEGMVCGGTMKVIIEQIL